MLYGWSVLGRLFDSALIHSIGYSQPEQQQDHGEPPPRKGFTGGVIICLFLVVALSFVSGVVAVWCDDELQETIRNEPAFSVFSFFHHGTQIELFATGGPTLRQDRTYHRSWNVEQCADINVESVGKRLQ